MLTIVTVLALQRLTSMEGPASARSTGASGNTRRNRVDAVRRDRSRRCRVPQPDTPAPWGDRHVDDPRPGRRGDSVEGGPPHLRAERDGPACDAVEILDRHNGVPTLGIVTATGQKTLFWQCADLGEASIWIYVPASPEDLQLLDDDEEGSLEGIVLGLETSRWATMGIAGPDNRLVFEREWYVPAGLTPDNAFDEIVRFAKEFLEAALETDLPPSRRDIMQHASDAVRYLVNA